MFEDLSVHSKILVTGPGRSGTTIAGKIIAQDTGHRYVDEAEFLGNHVNLFQGILERSDNIVVQCPSLFRWLIDNPPPGVFVVVMRRNVDDIRESFNRIAKIIQVKTGNLDAGAVAQEAYAHWDSVDPKPFPFLELQYDSDIRDHPLYVPEDQRIDFGVKQTGGDRAWPNSSSS
jgi:hypothetical protein